MPYWHKNRAKLQKKTEIQATFIFLMGFCVTFAQQTNTDKTI